jgi:AraC family transcriptional regulator
MNYFKKISQCIEYIEENLQKELVLQEIARQAGMSLYHCHRIFSALTGYSLKEYIRKRRLSLAAIELVKTKKRIIDIAYEYSYETPESFSRAFRQFFSVNPNLYRRGDYCIELLEKIDIYTIRSSIKPGGKMTEPEIIEKPAFKVMGYVLETNYLNGDNFKEIPKFWDEVMAKGLLQKIPLKIDPDCCLGICIDFREDGKMKYIIGYAVESLDHIPSGQYGITVPAAKYAVFTAKGKMPESIQNTVKYIYQDWFPNSEHERANQPEFELYDKKRLANPENGEVDIYIPLM